MPSRKRKNLTSKRLRLKPNRNNQHKSKSAKKALCLKWRSLNGNAWKSLKRIFLQEKLRDSQHLLQLVLLQTKDNRIWRLSLIRKIRSRTSQPTLAGISCLEESWMSNRRRRQIQRPGSNLTSHKWWYSIVLSHLRSRNSLRKRRRWDMLQRAWNRLSWMKRRWRFRRILNNYSRISKPNKGRIRDIKVSLSYLRSSRQLTSNSNLIIIRLLIL